MRHWIDLFENFRAEAPRTIIDVANHFLSMHDDLLDDDEEYDDFADMDGATAIAIVRRNYISGTCGAFAVALHDKLGLPIVGMNMGMHVAVQAPDGDIIDFDGKNPLKAVLKRYGMGPSTPVVERTREDVVDDVLMGQEEGDDPWDEIAVAKFVMNTLGRWG